MRGRERRMRSVAAMARMQAEISRACAKRGCPRLRWYSWEMHLLRPFHRGALVASVAVGLTVSALACTSILGDFEVVQAVPTDASSDQDVQAPPDAATSLDGVGQIAVGGNFACAIKATATGDPGGKMAWCWGDNQRGQTGRSSGLQFARPVEFDGLGTPSYGGAVQSICAGDAFGCVLAAQGSEKTIWCWGSNEQGQLGTGATDTLPHPEPSQITLPTGFDQPNDLSCGSAAACAVSSNGSGACWGSNRGGVIVRPIDSNMFRPPTIVGDVSTLARIGAGEHHACAVGNLMGGNPQRVMCWGNGFDGELGNGTVGDNTPNKPDLVQLLPDLDLLSIRVGLDHACSLDNSRQVFCWGKNDVRQVAPNDGSAQIPTARQTVPNLKAEHLSTGKKFSCAAGRMTADNAGAVMCWGTNSFGQLGTSDGAANVARVPGLSHPVAVSVGAASACAVEAATDGDTHGTVSCWGKNDTAQLGVGDTNNRSEPTKVLAPALL